MEKHNYYELDRDKLTNIIEEMLTKITNLSIELNELKEINKTITEENIKMRCKPTKSSTLKFLDEKKKHK